jgi:hypothetical protein
MKRAFGIQGGVAVLGNTILGIVDDSTLQILDASGAVPRHRVLREAVVGNPVTPEAIKIARSRELEALTPAFSSILDVWDRMPKPSMMPRFGWEGAHQISLMRTVSNGEVWIVQHGGVFDQKMSWLVLNSDGSYSKIVSVDEELDVLDVRDSRVLIKTWDADGVETIEQRSIIRSARIDKAH